MEGAGRPRSDPPPVFVKRLIWLAIRGYQIFIGPILKWLGGGSTGCRFEPSCSQYFLEAVETHGAARGSWLGICRLGRCQPWGGQGFDPVPPIKPAAEAHHASPESRQNLQCCK